MHAYLFVGGTNKIREEKIKDAIEKYGRVYDFPLRKIADVRSLADFTKYTQPIKTAIVIKDINEATKEALNAFLKILEEPGKNISYFLSSQSEQNLLSTITSRCQIKRFTRSSKNEKTNLVSDFLKLSFGEKIKYLEKTKKKDEVIELLQKLILSTHKTMIKSEKNNHQNVLFIKSAQGIINNLNLNANLNMQMTIFAINSGKSVFTKEV